MMRRERDEGCLEGTMAADQEQAHEHYQGQVRTCTRPCTKGRKLRLVRTMQKDSETE